MSDVKTICVYCGSSNDVQAGYILLAKELGKKLAESGIRLVYGGGGVGLMGACAAAANDAGGDVLGIIPRFLLEKEKIFEEVEHRIVEDMHTRKQMMFDEADAFIVLPGGIGTLEEAVEILSWARLSLHNKPLALLDYNGFWSPIIDFLDKTIELKFNPAWIRDLVIHKSDASECIAEIEAKLVELGR